MSDSSRPVTHLNVGLDLWPGTPVPVGHLVEHNRKIHFEYDLGFLQRGLDLSPFHLPLKTGVQTTGFVPFEGLFGVFNDSLPDGWGRLLFDRLMQANGIHPANITPLDRLAYVGVNGMGALTYGPVKEIDSPRFDGNLDLDRMASEALVVLEGSPSSILENLFALNGSSAGARPKAMIGINARRDSLIYGAMSLPGEYEHWLVKFPNSRDLPDSCAAEYAYSEIAREAGIEMPETHLFPSSDSAGYFAVKRFDRDGQRRFHVHTASGLLHTDFRVPTLDYESLIELTWQLTRDRENVEKIYRVAVFNVLAHNRDDHSKNFSFMMDNTGRWYFAPAYDLTYSSGIQSEHTTTVMGEGKNPTTEHLLKLAEVSKISNKRAVEIIQQTRDSLARWPELAKAHGVNKQTIDTISKGLGLTTGRPKMKGRKPNS